MNQKNEIDLQVFCRSSDKSFAVPFSNEFYTYATNGHIIVRVDRRQEMTGKQDKVRPEAISFTPQHDGEWRQLPDYSAAPKKKCRVCDGRGKVLVCPECGGEGEVVLSNDWHEYEAECKSCYGDGWLAGIESEKLVVCERCAGSGEVYGKEGTKIGGSMVALCLLDKLKTLPEVEVFLPELKGMINFRFAGGCGALMTLHD